MPVLLYTTGEIAKSLHLDVKKLSHEVRELADLTAKPLASGESVASRHHQIAKLGKLLAEAFEAFDMFMRGAADEGPTSDPRPTDQALDPQAN